MFVERLTKEELLAFVLKDEAVKYEYIKRCGTVDAIRYFSVDNGRVTFSIGNIDFVFTDFDVSNNYMFRSYNGGHNKAWIQFMYDKFGEDYRLAFYKFRTQEKRRLLKRVADQFDKDNRVYEKCFHVEDESEA